MNVTDSDADTEVVLLDQVPPPKPAAARGLGIPRILALLGAVGLTVSFFLPWYWARADLRDDGPLSSDLNEFRCLFGDRSDHWKDFSHRRKEGFKAAADVGEPEEMPPPRRKARLWKASLTGRHYTFGVVVMVLGAVSIVLILAVMFVPPLRGWAWTALFPVAAMGTISLVASLTFVGRRMSDYDRARSTFNDSLAHGFGVGGFIALGGAVLLAVFGTVAAFRSLPRKPSPVKRRIGRLRWVGVGLVSGMMCLSFMAPWWVASFYYSSNTPRHQREYIVNRKREIRRGDLWKSFTPVEKRDFKGSGSGGAELDALELPYGLPVQILFVSALWMILFAIGPRRIGPWWPWVAAAGALSLAGCIILQIAIVHYGEEAYFSLHPLIVGGFLVLGTVLSAVIHIPSKRKRQAAAQAASAEDANGE